MIIEFGMVNMTKSISVGGVMIGGGAPVTEQ